MNTRILLSFLILGLAGCTGAKPSLEFLGQLNQPSFDGKASKTISVDSLTAKVQVEGSCDVRAQNLEMAIAGQSFLGLSRYCESSEVQCQSSQSFSCKLMVSELKFTPGEEGLKTLEVRGIAEGSVSGGSQIHVIYKPPGPKINASVGAGTVTGENSVFKAKLRVSGQAMSADSGQFSIRPSRF